MVHGLTNSCRITNDNAERGDILRHHCFGTDYCTTPNSHPAKYTGTCCNPSIILYDDWLVAEFDVGRMPGLIDGAEMFMACCGIYRVG